MNVSFHAKATEATGKVSNDGATFDFAISNPSQIENVLNKGWK